MRIYRFISGTAAALALVTGLAAAEPAAARDRDRLSPGAAAAIGVLGGLAIGGAIAASQPPAPVYMAPPPRRLPPPPPPEYVESETVYYSRPTPPPPVYVERCVTERYNEWVPGWGWEQRTRRSCR